MTNLIIAFIINLFITPIALFLIVAGFIAIVVAICRAVKRRRLNKKSR